jgi:transposase-like protein
MRKKGLRQVRIFSEPLKRQMVSDIESGKVSVLAASRELKVSIQTVYRWLNRYSRHLQSSRRMVMEMKSESNQTKELQQRIMELEAALGRKQLEIDYLNKMIEIGSQETGVDLKKKFDTPPFNGSATTKGNMGTK